MPSKEVVAIHRDTLERADAMGYVPTPAQALEIDCRVGESEYEGMPAVEIARAIDGALPQSWARHESKGKLSRPCQFMLVCPNQMLPNLTVSQPRNRRRDQRWLPASFTRGPSHGARDPQSEPQHRRGPTRAGPASATQTVPCCNAFRS
jgi:hypothetical protein